MLNRLEKMQQIAPTCSARLRTKRIVKFPAQLMVLSTNWFRGRGFDCALAPSPAKLVSKRSWTNTCTEVFCEPNYPNVFRLAVSQSRKLIRPRINWLHVLLARYRTNFRDTDRDYRYLLDNEILPKGNINSLHGY